MSMILAFAIRTAETIFIVAFLLWMLFSDVSGRNYIRRFVVDRWLRRPFVWLGLNGGWRMFSPDPPKRAIWPQARLTMRDGSETIWEPEAFDTMPVGQKIAQKKFHTYYHQVVRPGVTPRALRDFTEYLLRSIESSESCVQIRIYRIAQPTPAFGIPATGADVTKSATLLFTFYPHPIANAN
jgi:hypothetical protein